MLGPKPQKCLLILAASVLIAAPPVWAGGKEPKVTVEELVMRHLESIGPAAARTALKSRMTEGRAQFTILTGGSGSAAGPATLLSDGRRLRLSMLFNDVQYEKEDLAYNGEKCQVGMMRPGIRSPFAEFFLRYDEIAKEGLLGGALSAAWSLLDVENRKPNLRYNGTRKVEGKQLHDLVYRPRKGTGNLEIHLYFEPETMRHVMTAYEVSYAAMIGLTPEQSVRQQDQPKVRLEESFSDFRVTDGLTLPLRWKLHFLTQSARRNSLLMWELSFDKVRSNVAAEATKFTVQ